MGRERDNLQELVTAYTRVTFKLKEMGGGGVFSPPPPNKRKNISKSTADPDSIFFFKIRIQLKISDASGSEFETLS